MVYNDTVKVVYSDTGLVTLVQVVYSDTGIDGLHCHWYKCFMVTLVQVVCSDTGTGSDNSTGGLQ